VRTFTVPLPIDLRRSLSPLVSSAQDPTIRLRADAVVRASATPDGSATLAVTQVGARRFRAEAWGDGARWALEHAPGLVGADDDLTGFDPSGHPFVARAHHLRPELRVVRTGTVWDLLVPTILAQRVTGGEAARAWTRLVRQHGTPAPGPFGLRLAPEPAVCAALPDHTWHRLGVERSRAAAVRSAARHATKLERALALPRDARLRAFCLVPGIGPWTSELTLRSAAGDADAVEVGDFHVKNQVAWNLADEPRGTDERMLELLAPFTGHRGRVVRLVHSAGRRPPAFGPRLRVVPVDRL
jgi:3-methyladenine DNA glycosylase/8-oxoguanine DNA glycosylase